MKRLIIQALILLFATTVVYGSKVVKLGEDRYLISDTAGTEFQGKNNIIHKTLRIAGGICVYHEYEWMIAIFKADAQKTFLNSQAMTDAMFFKTREQAYEFIKLTGIAEMPIECSQVGTVADGMKALRYSNLDEFGGEETNAQRWKRKRAEKKAAKLKEERQTVKD